MEWNEHHVRINECLISLFWKGFGFFPVSTQNSTYSISLKNTPYTKPDNRNPWLLHEYFSHCQPPYFPCKDGFPEIKIRSYSTYNTTMSFLFNSHHLVSTTLEFILHLLHFHLVSTTLQFGCNLINIR